MTADTINPDRLPGAAPVVDQALTPATRSDETGHGAKAVAPASVPPLRRQIALIAGGALVIVLAIMITFAEYRMSVQLERMALERSRSATELLTAVQRQDVAFLKRLTAQLTTDSALDDVREGAPAAALSTALSEVAENLEFETSFIALDAEGEMIAQHGVDEPEAFASSLASLSSEALQEGKLLVSRSRDGIWIAVSSQILRGDQVVGHIVGRVDLVSRVSEFFGVADSLAFVLPDGEVIIARGEREGLGEALVACCTITTPTDVIEIGTRLFTASVVPMTRPNGEELGTFVDLRDVTEEMAQLRPLRILSIVSVAVVVLLAFGVLMRSLRHALRPLGAVVRLLERLSDGQTEVHLKPVAAAREIESLIQSVEVFRAGVEARDRLLVLSEQLVAASKIQQSLLPRQFNLAEGLEIHGAMEPAEEVAGDFFDCFKLPDGRIGAVIADVAGKGIGAALFAARASALLRANAAVHRDPNQVLAATNDELCERNPEQLFISVVFAILTPETGHISLSNAGHCPPILIGPDGACRTLQLEPDLVLGAFPAMTYALCDIQMAPGEMLLLYSDGFDEARNHEDQLLGIKGVLEIAGRIAPLGAEGGVHQIFRELTSFAAGRAQVDDITLLALRRTTGAGAPAA